MDTALRDAVCDARSILIPLGRSPSAPQTFDDTTFGESSGKSEMAYLQVFPASSNLQRLSSDAPAGWRSG
jgi:hypothetical protein